MNRNQLNVFLKLHEKKTTGQKMTKDSTRTYRNLVSKMSDFEQNKYEVYED